MRCDEVQEILDRGKPTQDATLHVEGCAACRDYSKDLDISLRAFAAVPSETMSSGKSQELRSQVRQIARTRRTQAIGRPWWLAVLEFLRQPGPVLALAGACALMLLVVVARRDQVAQAPRESGTGALEASGSSGSSASSGSTGGTQAISAGPVIQLAVLSGEVAIGSRHVKAAVRGAGGAKGGGKSSPLGALGALGASEVSVAPDETIRSLADGPATVVVGSGIQVAMAPLSSMRVADRQLTLASGEVSIHVPKGGEGFTADSARLTARVMGTRFAISATRVDALEGMLAVSAVGGGSGSLRIRGGQGVAMTGDGMLDTVTLSGTRVSALVSRFAALEGGTSGMAADMGLSTQELSRLYLSPEAAPPSATDVAGAASSFPAPSASPAPASAAHASSSASEAPRASAAPSAAPAASAVGGASSASPVAPASDAGLAATPTATAPAVVNPIEGLGSQRK